MLPFFLYLAAGLLTAFHVYALLTMGMLGVPRNTLELISLIGSLCLIVSAYISLFRPRLAAKLALLAALGMWCFYGPAIAGTIKAGRYHQLSQLRVVALPYLALCFLALTTIYSTLVSFRSSNEGAAVGATWFFPAHASRRMRIAASVFGGLAVIGLSIGSILGAHGSRRPSSKFLIPDGYVGWVRVEFQIAGTPPVPIERDQYVFNIPPDGILKTSSPEQFGYGKDEFYYDSGRDLRRLPAEAANGRLVWGKINGENVGASGRRQYEEFFVGTEQQFKELAGAKKVPKPVADPPH